MWSPALIKQSRIRSKVRRTISNEKIALPQLPGKKLAQLTSVADIEFRRKGLEAFFEELLAVPKIMEAYAFRSFIEDPEIKVSPCE